MVEGISEGNNCPGGTVGTEEGKSERKTEGLFDGDAVVGVVGAADGYSTEGASVGGRGVICSSTICKS